MFKLGTYLQQRRKFVVSKQVVRNDTSIGANAEAAAGASSRADFSAKILVAY